MRNMHRHRDVVDDDDLVHSPAPFLLSCRFSLAVVGFFICMHLYAQRIGMSIAIVCMVNQTAIDRFETVAENDNLTHAIQTLPRQCQRTNESEGYVDGPFQWEKSVQGHILGSFFYGYLISQIPGGLLAERFGAKWVMTIFAGLSTVGTLLTPTAARLGFPLLIAVRVLCGIGSGAMFPAMHAMLGQWTPPLERSLLSGITYAGAMMGNVVALPLCGLLCKYGFDDGWGSIFYVIGISSFLILICWVVVTSNTPSSHRYISSRERQYIVSSLKGQLCEEKPKVHEMPWRKILTSGPVWAIVVANFCTDWGLYTYLTSIPMFYKEVLAFNIDSNGAYSALPFIGLWASMNLCPLVADKLRSSGTLSTAWVRKLFNSIGSFGAAGLLIGLSFLDCTQKGLAVTLLTVAVSITGGVFSGYFVNHMDIAPQYAGTLMGISNCVASISGFVAPYVASVLTVDQTRESWQHVFFVTAAIYVFGAIVYCVLASGSIQPWAVETSGVDENVVELEVVLRGDEEKNDTEKVENGKDSLVAHCA